MLPGYPLVLGAASADGAALTNTVTATNIMPASAVATIPAGALQVGSTVKIMLRGRMSTLVTTPGTLTLDIRFGSVVVSAFGAMNVNAQTNATWEVVLLATVRAVGSVTAANAICTGCFVSRALIGSPAVAAGGAGTAMLPDTAPAVGTGFDSTASQAINVFATWSVASASNSIQIHQTIVELKV
jgi:hypothetical protein